MTWIVPFMLTIPFFILLHVKDVLKEYKNIEEVLQQFHELVEENRIRKNKGAQ